MKVGLGLWQANSGWSGNNASRVGPMDYTADQTGLASITAEYNLASPVAIMAVAMRYSGTVTGLTVTHGGQALTAIQIANNTSEKIFSGLYVGSGLTIETANLVVTPIGGGTIGPAVLRINDDYGSSPILSSWKSSQQGLGDKATHGVMTASGVIGSGPIAVALATALVNPAPYVGPSTQFTTLLNAFAMAGTRVDAPAFSGGLNWALNAGWWEHGTGVSTLAGSADMASDLPAPFGYEMEVDIPVGASLSIQLTQADGSYMNTPIRAPVTGMVRFYDSTPGFIGKRWRILGNGPVRFRNLKYIEAPTTVQCIFSRSNINAADGLRTWFYFGTPAQFAGVAAAVYQ